MKNDNNKTNGKGSVYRIGAYSCPAYRSRGCRFPDGGYRYVKRKSTTNAEVEAKASAKRWFINAEISGKVTTARENTRMTNQTAKYQIHVSASQQPQTEGLSKLMDIMASCIEPINTESSK